MTDFIQKLTDAYEKIHCTDDAYRDAFYHEISVIEAFIDAVSEGEPILADGEKTTMEELDESTIQSVVTRLELAARGEPLPSEPFPIQDDACHHPGCDYEHAYDDDYFHDHCALCNAWLHIEMPIHIIRHSEKNIDFSTCYECTTDDIYLQGGYTDDSGHLQCIRADSNTLLRMLDVAYKRARIEGIESGQAFFEKREQYKSTYETIMNAIATEWKMGDDDNFSFLKDHANDLLEKVFSVDVSWS